MPILEYNEEFITQKIKELGVDIEFDEETKKIFWTDYMVGYEEGFAKGKGAAILVSTCKELGVSCEETVKKLREKFPLSEEEVQKVMDLYWQK